MFAVGDIGKTPTRPRPAARPRRAPACCRGRPRTSGVPYPSGRCTRGCSAVSASPGYPGQDLGIRLYVHSLVRSHLRRTAPNAGWPRISRVTRTALCPLTTVLRRGQVVEGEVSDVPEDPCRAASPSRGRPSTLDRRGPDSRVPPAGAEAVVTHRDRKESGNIRFGISYFTIGGGANPPPSKWFRGRPGSATQEQPGPRPIHGRCRHLR